MVTVLDAEDRLVTVGILADFEEGIGGGVNEVARGLITSLLGRLDRNFRYVLFLAEHNNAWSIDQSDSVSVIRVRRSQPPRGWRKWPDRLIRYGVALSKASKGDVLGARVTIAQRLRQRTILEAIHRSPWKLDVMHFPFQDFVPLGIPLIFSPWDLQHLHLKEFWPEKWSKARDAAYRIGCRLASCIALGSEWSREDVIARYGVERSKTTVVRVAPGVPMASGITLELHASLRQKYGLPCRFMFFPAVLWRHKNHMRLLEALAKVNQSSHPDIHLVCCGQTGWYLEELREHAERIGVADRVHFLGHIEKEDVYGLYALAEFCIYPSLFEGAALPVLEAFGAECAVAASNATCIPEYAGDAALLFDPLDVDGMADAISALASSETARLDLAARGKERVRHYSWDTAAAEYVSIYTKLACGTSGDTRTGF